MTQERTEIRAATRAEPLYLEDFRPGATVELGEIGITEAEIIDFGLKHDPQPFHVDVVRGRASAFGGLIASGWHTATLFTLLFTAEVLNASRSLGSPGVEELRWHRPVRPDDRLTGRYQVLEVTPSARNPMRGTVRGRGELWNQNGELAMSLVVRNMFERRQGSHPGDGNPAK